MRTRVKRNKYAVKYERELLRRQIEEGKKAKPKQKKKVSIWTIALVAALWILMVWYVGYIQGNDMREELLSLVSEDKKAGATHVVDNLNDEEVSDLLQCAKMIKAGKTITDFAFVARLDALAKKCVALLKEP